MNRKFNKYIIAAILFTVFISSGCGHLISRSLKPITPRAPSISLQKSILVREFKKAMDNKQYSLAEALIRKSMALRQGSMDNSLLLQVLEARGKYKQALPIYKSMAGRSSPVDTLRYSFLLLKMGQWDDAVDAYYEAEPPELKMVSKSLTPEMSKYNIDDPASDLCAGTDFSHDYPDPKGLAAAIHIGIGIIYSNSSDDSGKLQNDKAMSQFKQALLLTPKSELARHYFYDYGPKQIDLNKQFSDKSKPYMTGNEQMPDTITGYGTL